MRSGARFIVQHIPRRRFGRRRGVGSKPRAWLGSCLRASAPVCPCTLRPPRQREGRFARARPATFHRVPRCLVADVCFPHLELEHPRLVVSRWLPPLAARLRAPRREPGKNGRVLGRPHYPGEAGISRCRPRFGGPSGFGRGVLFPDLPQDRALGHPSPTNVERFRARRHRPSRFYDARREERAAFRSRTTFQR